MDRDKARPRRTHIMLACMAACLLMSLTAVFGVTAQEGEVAQPGRLDPQAWESQTNDAGFVVAPTHLEVWEPDGVEVFQVSLTSQPTDMVYLPLETSNNQCELVSTDTLVWAPTQWQDTKVVLVTAVDDGVQDDDQICKVWTGPALSDDPDYHGLNPDDVTVLVKDPQTQTFLPLLMRNHQTGLWEVEPNNTAATANGPVWSDRVYYGTFPSASDVNDYYYFDLAAAHAVEVWLTNIQTGCNYDLVLRDEDLVIRGYSANLGNSDEHIDTGTALVPGRYYIQVYNRDLSGSSQEYHLRVVYE